MSELTKKLKLKLDSRLANGALRSLAVKKDGLIDFCSNDYLGFAQGVAQPAGEVKASSGATGSRLISGNSKEVVAFEDYLSRFHQSEAALVFGSGYLANLGLIQALGLNRDIIFLYDTLIHASLRESFQLALGKSFAFRHNDLDHLEVLLKRFSGQRI